jgi:hypothetical protein
MTSTVRHTKVLKQTYVSVMRVNGMRRRRRK